MTEKSSPSPVTSATSNAKGVKIKSMLSDESVQESAKVKVESVKASPSHVQ